MFEEIIPLNPNHFFAIRLRCMAIDEKNEKLSKKHLLPDLSSFHGDFPFAQVYMGWNKEGVAFLFEIRSPLKESFFPNFQDGDAVELFIDTRDVKTSGYTTRFCHHFFFLPEAVSSESERIQAGEITRFRTEDAHPLCDPGSLFVEAKKFREHYALHIFIPSDCLHGYDPEQFNRLGFTYRVNRKGNSPQFFSASSEDFVIEQLPSLWASLILIK
jgi:hypothetical protein